MSLPTVALNENTPTSTSYVREGDDRIRELKTQIREILAIDHYYPSSGQNDACGRHKQVTLIEAADIGSGATGIPILGAQTVSGAPELIYTGEDDVDVQLTSGGKVNAFRLTDTQEAAGVKTFHDQAIFEADVDMSNQQAEGMCIENRTDDTGCTQTGRIWLRTDV